MNQRRSARRRYSLPAPATQSLLSASRVVPEGSDIFQRALLDLYTPRPKPVPRRTSSLGERTEDEIIHEEEEEEEDKREEEEDEESSSQGYMQPGVKGSFKDRRYSSPACLDKLAGDDSQEFVDNKKDLKDSNIVLKKHSQFRKEYFMKHGHWPSSASITSPMTPSQSSTGTGHGRRNSSSRDVAFGSSIAKTLQAGN